MKVNVLEYYSADEWQHIKAEADRHPTPCVIVDLNIIKRKYQELGELFPFSRIYYAVKANPAVEVLELLRDLGSNFDIASRYELDRVLALGVSPDRISYGNTIKKRSDIRYFYEKGSTGSPPRSSRTSRRSSAGRSRLSPRRWWTSPTSWARKP